MMMMTTTTEEKIEEAVKRELKKSRWQNFGHTIANNYVTVDGWEELLMGRIMRQQNVQMLKIDNEG